MGKFTKDNPAGRNTNGRPVGSKNHATLAVLELRRFIMEEGMEKFIESIQLLPPKEYVEQFGKIIEFALPKQARMIVVNEAELPSIEIRGELFEEAKIISNGNGKENGHIRPDKNISGEQDIIS
ncbi:MAG: hypothetical protein DRI24_24425 [Deltaproteobacteria bacterium]|nr:MAG: hypothetical protein DRI24_24425 [Deltaproteobacteria bacterium]